MEYAPYQRVPKPWSKKDTREGTIFKDPEYLEFLELLAKPVEYLPSAEVQLERKEAERNSNLACAGTKEGVIITPLMEYVRHKRALKSASQRSLVTSGKLIARGGPSSPATSSNVLSKRGADRSRSNTLYWPSQAASRLKEKSTYVPRREENRRRDRDFVTERKRRESLEVQDKKHMQETAVDLGNQGRDCRDLSNKKVLLLKEKEKDSSEGAVSGSSVLVIDNGSGDTPRHRRITSTKSSAGSLTVQQGPTSPGTGGSSTFKSDLRRDGSGRLGRASLQQQRSPVRQLLQFDQQADKDKRLPKPQIWRANSKELNTVSVSLSELESGSQLNNVASARFVDEKNEHSAGVQDGRRVRNKDKPDRPVWTVRRRADTSTGSEPTVSLAAGLSSSPPGEIVMLVGSHESNLKPAQFRNGMKLGLGVGDKGGESCTDLGIDSVLGYGKSLPARVLRGSPSQDLSSYQVDTKNEASMISRSSDMKAPGVSKSINVGHENGDSCVQTPQVVAERERRKQEALEYWSELGGDQRQARRDRTFPHVSRDSDSGIVPDASKVAKRAGGPSMYGGHEKQVWVAKSGPGP